MTPEQLFYSFPAPIPDLSWRLRDLVMDEAPRAEERVRARWKLLGFDLEQYFCAVAPQKDHVRLMFEQGVDLEDPDGRLEGTGSHIRFLRFETEEDVDEDVVRRFLRLAIARQAQGS